MNAYEDPHAELTEIAELLAEYGVKFIIIGGWALDRSHPNLSYRTNDIDFVVLKSDENYARLADALTALEVRSMVRGFPVPDPATVTADSLLRKSHWRFHSENGILDVMSSAGIISGYAMLARTAKSAHGTEQDILIADPKIIYVSKRYASREKDRTVLARLRSSIIQAEGPAAGILLDRMAEALNHALEEGTDEAVAAMEDTFSEPTPASIASPSTPPGGRFRAWRQRRAGRREAAARSETRRSVSAAPQPKPPATPAAGLAPRCGQVGVRSRRPCVRPRGHPGDCRYS